MFITESRKILFCYLISTIAIAVASYFEFIHYKVIPKYPPISWGILKDIIDPILIILFPWNGWVFFLSLACAILFRVSVKSILILWIINCTVMGLSDTIISFDIVPFGRLLRGIVFYGVIFGLLLVSGLIVRHCVITKGK